MKSDSQEEELIQACVDKQEWAQKKVYESFFSVAYSVSLRYASSKDDAFDIVQEGFIKVFNNIHKYQLGTSFNAWAKRIFINTAIDFYRKSIRRRTEDVDEVLSITSNDIGVLSNLAEAEIMKMVNSLSPAYRAVFNLYVVEGYSHKEIAQSLGITESTSRSNLVKARSKLKVLLNSQNGRN